MHGMKGEISCGDALLAQRPRQDPRQDPRHSSTNSTAQGTAQYSSNQVQIEKSEIKFIRAAISLNFHYNCRIPERFEFSILVVEQNTTSLEPTTPSS